MNSEDGGDRKFILCTDNSKDINAKGDYLSSKGLIGVRPSKTKKNEYKHWCNKVMEIFQSNMISNIIDETYEFFGISQRITLPRIKTLITGIRTDGSIFSKGLMVNLKYYKCDWIPRHPEDYLLSDTLCLHIKEMVQLRNSINIDNEKNVLILNKDDFNKTIRNPKIYHQIENIWVNQNLLMNSEEMGLLNKKGFKYIPKEFFSQELREVAE